MWDFVNQGGPAYTSGGYSVTNITLIANTNPYPITGTVNFTTTVSQTFSWDANGVPNQVSTDPKLYLVPVRNSTVSYLTLTSNTTLLTVNTYSQWASIYNSTSQKVLTS